VVTDASSQAIATIARNVRARRGELGWTLDELAGRSGVSKGMLVQIEQNRTNPSIGILSRIAEAFGVSLAALVELDQSPSVQLIGPDEGIELWHGGAGSVGRLLVGSDRLEHVELWEWRMAPGDAYPSQDHLPGTREMLHVHEGTLTLSVDGTDHTVPAGAAVVFDADRPHGYANRGRRAVRFTMVALGPPGQYDRREGAVHGAGAKVDDGRSGLE
jgi:transcriptional regulator with XRE-family HTH domain